MSQERIKAKDFLEKYDFVNRSLKAVEKGKGVKESKTKDRSNKLVRSDLKPVNESVTVTDNLIKFVIPAVCPKPRMTQRDKWLKPPRSCVARYWQFRNLVEAFLPISMPSVFRTLKIVVWIEMPKHWSKPKKREMNGTPHDKRGDVDNHIKAVMDCITKEDKAVSKVQGEKFWGTSSRIEVEISDF